MGTVIKLKVFSVLRWSGFHTSSCCTAKPGHFMKKIMGYSSKKKRLFCEPAILPSAELFSKGSQEGRYSGSARRASVLNKLFMRHVTDLMATGESSPEFLGHSIEINRVKISPDFRALNVFWVAKGTQDDELIEKILKKNAGFLRHELSTLKVMGVVPIIQFVKDKQYSQIMEVDVRLGKADFGEDYIPTEMSTKLKTQLELITPLPPSIRKKIEVLDEELSDSDACDTEYLLPPMPQDVLGLNHSEILHRIKRCMKTSEAIHRRNSNNELPVTQKTNDSPIEFVSNKERRAAFKEFLEKRELLRMRARRLEKKEFPDHEYMREELEKRQHDYFDNIDYDHADEDLLDDEVSED